MISMATAAWMAWALAISALVAPAAWLSERGLARLGLPTRWIWLGGLLLCLAVPIVGAALGDGEAPATLTLTGLEARAGDATQAVDVGGRPRRGMSALAGVVTHARRALDGGVTAAAAALASASAGLVGSTDADRFLAVAWAVASLALALLLLLSAGRLGGSVRGWPRERILGRDVRVSSGLGPATVGLRRPEIVLPSWARELPPAELELVLTHEEEHVRMRDPLVLAAGLLAAVACPWNPLLWWQQRRLKDAVEVDCDRRVIERGAGAAGYAELLLRMGSRAPRGPLPVPTMTGPASLLERRLTAMKKTRLGRALPGALGTFAASLTLIALACGTEPPVTTSGPGDLDAQAAQLERNELVADLWVEPDGTVFVNDERHAMQEVAEVVGALDEASDGALVIALAGEPGVPYHVMDALQHELRAAGATRVVFAESSSRPGPTPPGDLAEVADGLPLVLPTEAMSVPVSGRNLLHLVVQASGTVEVRRGQDPRIQRIRPAEVEAVWRQEVAANPSLIAALKTHPDASYSDMLGVLDALRAADAQRISLQTLTN